MLIIPIVTIVIVVYRLPMPAPAKRAVGYIRVSTVGQAEEGVSLEAQAEAIKSWCLISGYELLEVYRDDGLSGTREDRPGLIAAIEAAKKGMALVSYSMSRIARSTRMMLDIGAKLERRGVDLVSITERIDTTSAAGRMVFQIFAVFAEFERNQTAERTKNALAHMKKRCEPYSPTPFGFDVVKGRLKEVSAEIAVVRQCVSMRSEGATYRKIADTLNGQGIAGKQGGKWYASTVSYMLKRQIS